MTAVINNNINSAYFIRYFIQKITINLASLEYFYSFS